MERAADLAGAVRAKAGERFHVGGGGNHEELLVERAGRGAPGPGAGLAAVGRSREAGGELGEVVATVGLQGEQLDARWRGAFSIPGGRWPEDPGGVDGGEVAAEADREAAVRLLELVEVDGLLQLPVGVGVTWRPSGGDHDARRTAVPLELVEAVGPVDLDEREVRTVARVAAAGTTVAEQHADVHVGAGRERGDRSRGEVGAGGWRERLPHPAVRGRGADLDQPAGGGKDLQIVVKVAGV